LRFQKRAQGRWEVGFQGQVILGAQGLVRTMEDVGNPKGVEKKEE